MTREVLAHLLFVIVLVLPFQAVRGIRTLDREILMRPTARLDFYQSAMIGQWLIVLVVVAATWGHGPVLTTLGFVWPLWTVENAAVAVLVTVLMLTQTPVVPSVRSKLASSRALQRGLYPLRNILPHSKAEKRSWILLSLTAGICEEAIFRGFLFFYFQEILDVSLYGSVILSSVIFGLSHLYQGTSNIVRTGIVGLLLGITYAVTSSLLVPILLHIVLDLGGLYMGEIVPSDDRPGDYRTSDG